MELKSKVKKLLWRASNDCLPTKVQLGSKYVDVNVTCSIRNKETESIYHVLISCRFANACLNAVGSWIGEQEQQSFMDWLADIFKMKQGKEINTVVMLVWFPWRNRNNLVWKQRGMMITEVVESVKINT